MNNWKLGRGGMIDKRTAFKLLVYSKNPEPLITRKTEVYTVKKFFHYLLWYQWFENICLTKFLIYIPYFFVAMNLLEQSGFFAGRQWLCMSFPYRWWHVTPAWFWRVGCYCAANIPNICYCIYECRCCLCDHAYIRQNLKQLSVSLKTGSVASWISDRCHNILQVIKHKSDQK